MSNSLWPHGLVRHAPLSIGFPRQEYWSGLPFPSPRDLPDPRIEPMSPALQADSTNWITREDREVDKQMLLYTLSLIVRRTGNIKNSLGHINIFTYFICLSLGFPGGSDGKASAYNEGDPGSIPGSGRSPGEGNGNPLQYFCLENPMNRGAC